MTEELISLILSTNDKPVDMWRQGVVTAVSGGTVTVQIGNASTPVAGLKYLSSYSPVAGDVVHLLPYGSTFLVLGVLASSAPFTLAPPVQVTAPFSTTTVSSTLPITGATITFDAVAGQVYEVSFNVPLVYFSAATAVSVATALRILAGTSPPSNLTGTQIQDSRLTTSAIAGSGGGQPADITTYWTAPSTGKFTIQAFAVTAATAGTYNWTCGATSPMNLAVKRLQA